jgi:hypothetical protein
VWKTNASAVKAWVNFDGRGISCAVTCYMRGASNIDRVVRTSTGRYQVYFKSGLISNIGYAVTVGYNSSGADINGGIRSVHILNQTLDSFAVGTNASADSGNIEFAVVSLSVFGN